MRTQNALHRPPALTASLSPPPLPVAPVPASPVDPTSAATDSYTTIYTDGSRLKDNEGTYRTGFAAVVTAGPFLDPSNRAHTTAVDPLYSAALDPDNLPEETIWGSCFGTSPLCSEDNYAAEIVALLAAYLLTPRDGPHRIFSDNLASTQVAHSFSSKKRRAQLKLTHHNLFRALAFRACRPSILLQHVRAHVGIHGNELADRLAKAAALATTTPQPHTHPTLLAIDQLVAMCSFPVAVSFHPVTIASTGEKMFFSTLVTDKTTPYTPQNYFAHHIRSLFHSLASHLTPLR